MVEQSKVAREWANPPDFPRSIRPNLHPPHTARDLMHSAPSPTRHRTARLTAWLQLWLVWFVGACAVWWKGSPRDLDRVARAVRDLILIETAARFEPLPRSRNRRGRLKPTALRTIAGSALRRALSGRDGPSRLAAILTVFRDRAAHVARLLRRLRRCGLTRLRVLLPERCADALHDEPPHAVACADTS